MPSLTPLTLLSAIALTALSFSLSPPAAAQQLPPLPIEFSSSKLANPGRPGGRRRDIDAQGRCQEGLPLSAIAYADTQIFTEQGITYADELVGTLTTSAQPSLWFYLPQPLIDLPTEFVLKDSNDQLLYRGRLTGDTDRNGIVAAPLPVTLLPDVPYQWYLTVDCDKGDRATVNGWIERRLPSASLANDLGEASARNRAALYANAGFLQDTLTELANLRSLQPESEVVDQEWQDFLTALDLSELVRVTVLDCCTVSNVPITTPEELTEPPVVEEDSVEESTEESTENLEPAFPAAERDTRTILQRARDRG